MNNHKYICDYCHVEYVPKRRFLQKYCSNSCRSKAYHRRQVEKGVGKNTLPIVNESENLPTEFIEQKEVDKKSIGTMSAAGIGNAAAGTLLADLIKHAFQGEGNRPATKNDIAALLGKLERYHMIINLPPKPFGKHPYFDLHTNEVVYF